MTLNKRFLADLGERAGRSFLQGFFGLWLANPTEPIEFDTLFTMANLKAGVVMAALSIGMALASKPVNNKDSASLLPPEAQPPAPQPPEINFHAPLGGDRQEVIAAVQQVLRAQPPGAGGLTAEQQLAEQLARISQPIAAPPPPAPDVQLGGTPERLEAMLRRQPQ